MKNRFIFYYENINLYMGEGGTMGRRNKSYYKDLHKQAYERLNSMQAFGESRRAAKSEGADRDKIFSFNTYKSYWKHTKYFIKIGRAHV